MSFGSPRRETGAPNNVLLTAIFAVIVIGALYWARAVIIPLALAIFLTFVLSPSVSRLRRFRLGRVPSVLIVVSVTLVVVVLFGWLISSQVAGLIQALPEHTDRIRTKLLTIMPNAEGELGQFLRELEEAFQTKPGGNEPAFKPVPVVIESRSPGWLAALEASIGPLAELLGQALITFVLAVFLLLNREDMRNRLLRLVGTRRLTATTKAMDDAGHRISRFLRMQLLINATFVAVLAVAFLLIGVRFAILWGFVAALLRYVPYIGAWFGLLPPLVASFAMSDTWWPPLAVIVVYAILELIVSNVAEPRLLGHSLGMSEVAQVFSAAFWAFLWGPIGLVLSGPLSACLLVLGHHVPQLRFFAVLLGVEEALSPDVVFYQRLAARDRDEASMIASEFASANSTDAARDSILVPTLGRAQQASAEGELSEHDANNIVSCVREIADELDVLQSAGEVDVPNSERIPLVVMGAAGEGDVLAAEFLIARLDAKKWDIRRISSSALSSELLTAVAEHEPAAVVITSLAPGGRVNIRYLCKRLRARHSNLKLLVGRWGDDGDNPAIRDELLAAGADEVMTDLPATVQHLQSWWSPLATQAGILGKPNDNAVSAASVETAV